MPETYHPILLTERAKRLRYETNNWAIHSAHEANRVTISDIGRRYLLRPLRMLMLEPILILVTVYTAFIFGELAVKQTLGKLGHG